MSPPAKRREPEPGLTSAMYAILLALGRGPLHGYAIMKEIERRTAGRERLLPGSLYNTIARMLDSGLLAETDPPDTDSDPERRRYYRITKKGRAAALSESTRLAALLTMATQQGLATSPPP